MFLPELLSTQTMKIKFILKNPLWNGRKSLKGYCDGEIVSRAEKLYESTSCLISIDNGKKFYFSSSFCHLERDNVKRYGEEFNLFMTF